MLQSTVDNSVGHWVKSYARLQSIVLWAILSAFHGLLPMGWTPKLCSNKWSRHWGRTPVCWLQFVKPYKGNLWVTSTCGNAQRPKIWRCRCTRTRKVRSPLSRSRACRDASQMRRKAQPCTRCFQSTKQEVKVHFYKMNAYLKPQSTTKESKALWCSCFVPGHSLCEFKLAFLKILRRNVPLHTSYHHIVDHWPA